MTAQAYIGTSGWNYPRWRHAFYRGVPQRRWLAHCAEVFTGIEVDGSFYRLLAAETLTRWRDATPSAFRFAMKGHRYVTHNKKLRDPDAPVAKTRDAASALAPKLAAVVWQLPRSLHCDRARLSRFVAALAAWPSVRHAIEFRDRSWFDDRVAAILGDGRVASCISDAPDWPMWDAVTTDLVYVRLHGHTRTYASSYRRRSLAQWAGRVRGWLDEGRDVHVYLDNDAEGAAPKNARSLLELLR